MDCLGFRDLKQGLGFMGILRNGDVYDGTYTGRYNATPNFNLALTSREECKSSAAQDPLKRYVSHIRLDFLMTRLLNVIA